MGVTKIDGINATGANFKLVSNLPLYPYQYYESAQNDVDSVTWKGGETCVLTTDDRLYIQMNTSGKTANWKRLVTSFTTF